VNEKTYGEGSDQVALSLINMAAVSFVQEAYDKAEPMLLRAVHIDQALYGYDGSGMIPPLSVLCDLYDKWGKPDKSEPCRHQLLSALEKQYGPDSPVLLSTLTSEAQALRSLGRTEEAAKLEQRLNSIRVATGQTGKTPFGQHP